MNKQRKIILPLVIIFIIFNGFFLTASTFFNKWGIVKNVLLIANGLFFILSLLTFLLQLKALKNKNPNVFVRSVMGGMMMKMFVCVIALAVYVILNFENVNKRTIFAAMLLYLIYLAVEVRVLTRLNHQKNG